MTDFIKWRSINKFSDIFKMATKHNVATATINAKVKLHGTNGGLRLVPGGIQPQKRSGDCSVTDDNAGFARWVEDTVRREDDTSCYDGVVIYGEWAGNGIQSGDAVCQAQKTFYVFAIRMSDEYTIVNPSSIETHLEKMLTMESLDQIRVIPWLYDQDIVIELSNHKQTQEVVDNLVSHVDQIGECDPLIKQLWGIEGPGEGLVGYFTSMTFYDGTEVSPLFWMDCTFKVKTVAHSVQKNKNRGGIGVEKPEGVDDFVQMFVTNQRMEQMLTEIGGFQTELKPASF